MEKSIVNVNATGITREYDAQYKIKVLKANIPFADQVTEENTKYVIRWNYDLWNTELKTLHFDSSQVSSVKTTEKIKLDTAIVAYNASVESYNDAVAEYEAATNLYNAAKDVYDAAVAAYEADPTEENRQAMESAELAMNEALENMEAREVEKDDAKDTMDDALENKDIAQANYDAIGGQDYYYWTAVNMEANSSLLLTERAVRLNDTKDAIISVTGTTITVTEAQTVYIGNIAGTYTYEYGKSIVVPDNCILKFDGGSLNNGIITGNSAYIDADPYEIFKENLRLVGDIKNEAVIPEWFGAIADSKTDNTAAFQRALNVNADLKLISTHGKYYRIRGTLYIDTAFKKIFTDTGAFSSQITAINFIPATQKQVLFQINSGEMITFASLRIYCSGGTDRGVVIDNTIWDDPDKDMFITNCYINNCYQVVRVRGRGLTMRNCQIGSPAHIAALYWDYDIEDNHPTEWNHRGLIFQDNRWHSVSGNCIRVYSGHANGMVIQNNICDNGRGRLVYASKDEGWGWIVTGNEVQQFKNRTAQKKSMCLIQTLGLRNCVIANNNMHQADPLYYWGSDSGVTLNGFIGNVGVLEGCVITGNIGFSRRFFLYQSSGDCKDNIVCNNSFEWLKDTASTNGFMYCNKTTNKEFVHNIIKNNVVEDKNPDIIRRISILYFKELTTIQHNIVVDNTINSPSSTNMATGLAVADTTNTMMFEYNKTVGTSEERPNIRHSDNKDEYMDGFRFFDKTLNKIIYYNYSRRTWQDSSGESINVDENEYDFYVDNNATGDIEDGTAQHPFKSLDNALNVATVYYNLILHLKASNTEYVGDFNLENKNIQITSYDGTAKLKPCGKFNNCKVFIKDIYLYTDVNLKQTYSSAWSYMCLLYTSSITLDNVGVYGEGGQTNANPGLFRGICSSVNIGNVTIHNLRFVLFVADNYEGYNNISLGKIVVDDDANLGQTFVIIRDMGSSCITSLNRNFLDSTINVSSSSGLVNNGIVKSYSIKNTEDIYLLMKLIASSNIHGQCIVFTIVLYSTSVVGYNTLNAERKRYVQTIANKTDEELAGKYIILGKGTYLYNSSHAAFNLENGAPFLSVNNTSQTWDTLNNLAVDPVDGCRVFCSDLGIELYWANGAWHQPDGTVPEIS